MGPRIALVSREFPPDHGGGIGSYAARIVPALAHAGARVHVITRRLGPSQIEIDTPPGVTVHRIEMGDRSGESCLRASIVAAQKLLDIARTDGLDAIEFAEYEAMASAWLALRSLDEAAASIPVAVHLHSPTELNAELNGHNPRSLDRAMQNLIEAERRTIALADGVCAPGSFMADWASQHFVMSERPTVIPYPAVAGNSPIPNRDSRTLLYVGRLEHRKGVDTLIRAWNRIALNHPEWTLRFVGADTNTAPGGGSCREWLQSLLDPSLCERTLFSAPMNAEELAQARASAAVAVIPSRWENFPNTCIEAMACQIPIVASDHGGMAEMLGLPAMRGAADGPCGSVFSAGDDAQLAQALERWMSMDPELRITAGMAAYDRITDLCDPKRVSDQRLRWMKSLRPQRTGIDPSLARLLHIDDSASASTMDAALARTLERFDHATGAAARAGDPAQWIERVRGVFADLAERGLSPVALYGAGHFTRSIGPALENSPAEVACIIDDHPDSQGLTLHGLPIVSQSEAIKIGVRAAVLSANQWEDTLLASSEPLRKAGIEVVRLFTKRSPRVMIVESGTDTRHFAGVAAELQQRGVEVAIDTQHAVYPVPDDDTDLVCIADVLAPRNIAVARTARAKGIRTLLMMDGVVEWRNTFINPLAGPNFLRPAPVDYICCATNHDEHRLREFGNNAVATGLPRLDSLTQIERDSNGPLLVATANTPWFDTVERDRLIEAMRTLIDTAASQNIPIRWRLTGGLDRILGVENHPGSLAEAMDGCRGVLATPSTLLLEAPLAGLPEASIEAFGPVPWTLPAAWSWCPDGEEGEFSETVELDHVLDLLSSPLSESVTPERRMRMVYPPVAAERTAAELVADRIEEVARRPGATTVTAPLLEPVRLPDEWPRTDRPRAVSVIVCDGSPTSGVTTFSLRMSAESGSRNHGWEWHTLLVQTNPKNAANDGLRELSPDDRECVHVAVLDPTADHHETLSACREAIERLHPDVLVPNFSDMTWAIAAQLRHQGVRTLGIMHSDDEAYRSTLSERPLWSSGVAVSSTCAQQMREIAARIFDAPPTVQQITYGAPVAESPPQRSEEGRLHLLYVGRLIEHQKRVSRLIDLASHLRHLDCDFVLDLIGDGPSEHSLRSRAKAAGLDQVIRFRGRMTPDQVQQELATADALVLTSDFEGTSIAMLEAMGQGALPCVSRVESGVDEWIIDGENGLTAPVGDTSALAERIASIASDKARLRRMQHAAWETARSRASTSIMYERYERVLDETLRAPLKPTTDTLGLHLTENGRWFKPWCDNPDGAKAYARRILTEAGYTRIADGTPTPGCDAVLADVLSSPEAVCLADEWRERGIAVAYLPFLIRPGWIRFGAVMRRVAEGGSRRIALYGAGQHTRRVLPVLRDHLPIVGIIDDHAAGQTIRGLPVVAPDAALSSLAPDAIVLSSDSIEGKLWHASRMFRDSGIPVHAVYGEHADSPERSALATP